MTALAWPLVVFVLGLLVMWRVDRWASALGGRLENKLWVVERTCSGLSEQQVALDRTSAQLEAWAHESRTRLEKLESELKVAPPAKSKHSAEVLARFGGAKP